GVNRRRQAFACLLEGAARSLAHPVHAGGVTELLLQVREHGGENAFVYLGGGGVVEIDLAPERRAAHVSRPHPGIAVAGGRLLAVAAVPGRRGWWSAGRRARRCPPDARGPRWS